MALGPIMKLKTDAGLQLELAPFTREEVIGFMEGFQKESVMQYLSFHTVQTSETEQEWYDKTVKEQWSLVWGIWVVEPDGKKLVGNIALNDIQQKHTIQATNGIAITDKQYWCKGIASAAHRALVWYAFRIYGMTRIKSAVMQPNVGSWRAMEKCGYTVVYTERNEQFVRGKLVHLDCLECLNPDDWAWRLWWGTDRPTRKSVEARAKTLEALQWAEENVELL